MFVSGPGRDQRDRLVRGADRVGDEVDGVPRRPARSSARQRRAVHAALAVDVLGDERLAAERAGGADGDRHVGPADELEQLQRVDRRLLERLVAMDGRDADELDLRAREREQERDRVVVAGVAVEDDLHGASIVVYLAPAVGSDGCAPGPRRGERAGRAGAAQRLVARSRPRAARRARQAVNASPAAVPSTASTARRRGAGDLLPVLEQHRALGAERERGQAVVRRRRLELVAVDDQQVDLGEHARRERAGRARR